MPSSCCERYHVGEKSREQILRLEEIRLASRSPHQRAGARRSQPTRLFTATLRSCEVHTAAVSASVAK
jgi:hypothetical protein